MLGERRSGREKEKYGGFEETGEWFLIKHGSSQFQYQRHSRQDVDTIGFIYFYRVSLSSRTLFFSIYSAVYTYFLIFCSSTPPIPAHSLRLPFRDRSRLL